MNFSAAFPTFFITLREGVEAALVIGIVLAALMQSGCSSLRKWVYWGIAAGLGCSVLSGLLFVGIIRQVGASASIYAPVVQESLETLFCLMAIIFLSWMLVWMTRQARSLKGEIKATVHNVLGAQNEAWGIFGLVTIAVLREGLETVLFILSQLQDGLFPSLGALFGLLSATAIGFLIFRSGVRVNLRLFFRSMGVLLLLIVSGLVISLLHKVEVVAVLLMQLHPQSINLCLGHYDSCLLGFQIWDGSQILPDQEFPGVLLKALFGYRQELYLVQAIGYLTFLVAVSWLYLKSLGDFVKVKSESVLTAKLKQS